MLEGLRMFLFGDGHRPRPPEGAEAIPQRTRDAHHNLRNTAMRMKQTEREIHREANDLLELLARDIRESGGRRQ
jgi:hypothetical protein